MSKPAVTALQPGMGIAARGMLAAFVIFTVLNTGLACKIYSAIRGSTEGGLAWYYTSAMTVMFGTCVYLMFSKWGPSVGETMTVVRSSVASPGSPSCSRPASAHELDRMAVVGGRDLPACAWFVTSSDSGTLVIRTMLSMGGDKPPKTLQIVWGMGDGLVAAVLLLAGRLKALQTASIAAASPISLVLLLMTWGLVKSLREAPLRLAGPQGGLCSQRHAHGPETGYKIAPRQDAREAKCGGRYWCRSPFQRRGA